jgi:hypothetical protein
MSDHVNLYREQGVDSSASAPATPVWSPPSGLTDTARNALIKAVDRVPSAWLLPPQDGELFDRPAEVYARLQGYALSTGFAVVGGSGSTSVRKNYLCIHTSFLNRSNKPLTARLSHDKTTKRSMLGVEVAVQQADKEEVAAQQADVQVVPNTPPGRKRTHTLVERCQPE